MATKFTYTNTKEKDTEADYTFVVRQPFIAWDLITIDEGRIRQWP
jgi:hypothetical protein